MYVVYRAAVLFVSKAVNQYHYRIFPVTVLPPVRLFTACLVQSCFVVILFEKCLVYSSAGNGYPNQYPGTRFIIRVPGSKSLPELFCQKKPVATQFLAAE